VTTVLDLWRWLDPEARLVSGSAERLARPVRGVGRSRAAPPHLPTLADGALLVVDASVVPGPALETLVAAVSEAGIDPAAIWVAGAGAPDLERADADVPILAGEAGGGDVERRAASHLDREQAELTDFASALRLTAAEAALADPRASAPAGVVASRLRRGVAVSVDGELVSLNPRTAGRALATRFAAGYARLGASRSSSGATQARRTRDGLWLLERPIGVPGATAVAWLFDDLPMGRVDQVALDALSITLRALLRRRPAGPPEARAVARVPPSTGDALRDTLLAVARANGRVAPAARSLGVHRNTVLYRLRRASRELGIDPRRPDDALRLLRPTEDG
jgi:hypothetical protein